MKAIVVDETLIAYCGLYCGACKKFIKEECLGCYQKGRYKKCKMRPCCLENNYRSCADCKEFEHVMECKKFTNPLWNILEFIFGTKRSASIDFIREKGYSSYANHMAEKKLAVIKRKFQ